MNMLEKKIILSKIRKVVIGCVTCSGHQDRNPRAWILPFWSKTDMYSLKQNLCLAPDQKMIGTKEVENDQKINLVSGNFLVFFLSKNSIKCRSLELHIKSFFPQKNGAWVQTRVE